MILFLARVGPLLRSYESCRLQIVVGATLLACFVSHAAASGQFVIVSKGQPKTEIIADGSSAEGALAFAALELQRYVREMSGAELPILHAPSRKPSILLAVHASEKAVKGSQDPREEDHYRLIVDSKKVQIQGASPRAVLFGVYDLLERLGCGWCVPGDDTVPKKETLGLSAMQLDTRPAFQYRMMLDYPLLSVSQSMAIVDWLAKNRMNWVHPAPNATGEPKSWYARRDRVVPELRRRGLGLIIGGHTMHTWLPDTYFPAHPEWFGFADGKRKPPTLCLANLEMTAELTKNMQHFLDRCPEVDVIDLWHPDLSHVGEEFFCHCARCTRGLLSESEGEKGQRAASIPADAVQSAYVIGYVEFVNRVAAAIGKSHPKVMVGPLIYGQTDRAMPDGCPQFAENVMVGLAHINRDSYRPLVGEPKSAVNTRFLGDDLTWIAKSTHHFIYEYYNAWFPPYIYPGAQVIAHDLQILQDLDVQGSSSDMYGYSPINMYVAARAVWSPNISWQEAIRDFCARYYDDVAQEMADNEIRLETGIFGLRGHQGEGAINPVKEGAAPKGGSYLKEQRAEQIEFLKRLIDKTKNERVKVRLERQLKPWSLWDARPNFWAFPDFKD